MGNKTRTFLTTVILVMFISLTGTIHADIKEKDVQIKPLALSPLFLLLNGNYSSQPLPEGWTHPSNLADYINLQTNSVYPQTAMDDNGNGMVVWKYDQSLYKSEFIDKEWTYPKSSADDICPSGGNGSLQQPQIALGGNKTAIIVWAKMDDEGISRTYMSEYRKGSWTHPASTTDYISPNTPYVWRHAYSQQVAMGGDEHAVIVWHQGVGTIRQIFASLYQDGHWDHPGTLAEFISVPNYDAMYPQAAMNRNGEVLVTWQQKDQDNKNQIFVAHYTKNPADVWSWDTPVLPQDNISPDGYNAEVPMVSMNDDGDAIIIWKSDDKLYKSEYINDVWNNPVDMDSYLNPPGVDIETGFYYYDVAMDNSGNAIIIWIQRNQTTHVFDLFKSEKRGGIWSHPATENSFLAACVESPAVAMDNNGNALVAWTGYKEVSGTRYRYVFMQEYRNGSWGEITTISPPSSATSSIRFIDIAMSDNGNAIITWGQGPTTSEEEIYKSVYIGNKQL